MVKPKKSVSVVPLSDEVARTALFCAFRCFTFNSSLCTQYEPFEVVALQYLNKCGIKLVMPKDLHDSIIEGDENNGKKS